MKINKLLLGLLVCGAVLTSCSSDDDEGNSGEPQVTAPAAYTFERDGKTTVSYGGQTTRIKMGEELIKALKDNTKTEAELDGMFAHQKDNNDFSDADLNASNKSIRSKTAASKDYFSSNTTEANAIKADFDAWIKEQVDVVFLKWDDDASAGNPGKIQEAGGGSTRYVNAKGLELNQAVNKSLIGALMVDQMLNNYLGTATLDDGTNREDNDKGVLAEGKNYTTMEHKWDEAFGYLYGTDNAEKPAYKADSFLSKYLSRVEADSDFAGIAKKIYDAFKLGRAAIVAKNYTVRDEQAAIIRDNVSKIIAVRAVYYLQQGKANLSTDKASAFHDLSEGFGFIYSLRFTRDTNTNKPHLPIAEIKGFIDTLMKDNGFWDVSADTLDQISTRIASAYGFTVEQAAN